jgi:hypothetical protein
VVGLVSDVSNQIIVGKAGEGGRKTIAKNSPGVSNELKDAFAGSPHDARIDEDQWA